MPSRPNSGYAATGPAEFIRRWRLRLHKEFTKPEGAACVAALEKLLRAGFLQPRERIVI